MVGRKLFFCEGYFWGAILNLRNVICSQSLSNRAVIHPFHQPAALLFIVGDFWAISTRLKNMLVRLDHFPKDRGEHEKIFELPSPSFYSSLKCSTTFSSSGFLLVKHHETPVFQSVPRHCMPGRTEKCRNAMVFFGGWNSHRIHGTGMFTY